MTNWANLALAKPLASACWAKANPAAIDNVDEFKKTIDSFEAPNSYLKDPDARLKYVGTTSFGQKRQVAVPMVVNEYKDGKFETLFVGTVD